MEDPLEKLIATRLKELNIEFRKDERTSSGVIDFYLPDFGIFIEVCQFYTDRKIRQLEGIENVILIQGLRTAEAFVKLLGLGM